MENIYNYRPSRRTHKSSRREYVVPDVAPSVSSHASHYAVDPHSAYAGMSLLPERPKDVPQGSSSNSGIVMFIKNNALVLVVCGVVLLGVLFAVYYFFYRKRRDPPPPPPQALAPAPLPFGWAAEGTEPAPAREPEAAKQRKPTKRQTRRRRRVKQQPRTPVESESESEQPEEESEYGDNASERASVASSDRESVVDESEEDEYPVVEVPPELEEGLRQLKENNHTFSTASKTQNEEVTQEPAASINRPSARKRNRKKRRSPNSAELERAMSDE